MRNENIDYSKEELHMIIEQQKQIIEEQEKENKKLLKALQHYADPSIYESSSMFGYPIILVTRNITASETLSEISEIN